VVRVLAALNRVTFTLTVNFGVLDAAEWEDLLATAGPTATATNSAAAATETNNERHFTHYLLFVDIRADLHPVREGRPTRRGRDP
jgi:hypothetical protein